MSELDNLLANIPTDYAADLPLSPELLSAMSPVQREHCKRYQARLELLPRRELSISKFKQSEESRSFARKFEDLVALGASQTSYAIAKTLVLSFTISAKCVVYFWIIGANIVKHSMTASLNAVNAWLLCLNEAMVVLDRME